MVQKRGDDALSSEKLERAKRHACAKARVAGMNKKEIFLGQGESDWVGIADLAVLSNPNGFG